MLLREVFIDLTSTPSSTAHELKRGWFDSEFTQYDWGQV
jgi:hypothetical protein